MACFGWDVICESAVKRLPGFGHCVRQGGMGKRRDDAVADEARHSEAVSSIAVAGARWRGVECAGRVI